MPNNEMQKIVVYAKEYLEKVPVFLLEEPVGIISKYIVENIRLDKELQITEYLSFEKIDHILEEFLKSVSPDILYNYQNIKGNDAKSVYYTFINGEKQYAEYFIKKCQALKEKGELSEEALEKLIKHHKRTLKKGYGGYVGEKCDVHLALDDTLNDVFTIGHEMMHKIWYQVTNDDENNPLSFEYLAEVNSLTIELLLKDYLASGIYSVDAEKYIQNRIRDVVLNAYEFEFQRLILRIVKEHGKLNKTLLDSYILKCDPVLQYEFTEKKDYYMHLIIDNGFYLTIPLRYIFGFFAACKIKMQITENKENVSLLFEIGANMYEKDLETALKNCGLNYFTVLNNGEVQIDVDKINEMCECMIKEVSQIQKKLRK